jgi:hypothetical protein
MRGLEPPASATTTRRSNQAELHPPRAAPDTRCERGGYGRGVRGSKRTAVGARMPWQRSGSRDLDGGEQSGDGPVVRIDRAQRSEPASPVADKPGLTRTCGLDEVHVRHALGAVGQHDLA